MSKLIKIALALAVVGGASAAAYQPVKEYLEARNRVEWETAEVVLGDVTRYVNSTGTVHPVLSVSVGSFVSGPIVELNVDFNDEVKKGQVLARIDPRIYRANVQRDEAALATQQASVEQIDAQLQLATNSLRRGRQLQSEHGNFLSEEEMDSLIFQVKGLEAQKKLAEAQVLQAEASLENSRANLNYTEITAPVDGVVIDRKIDPGQTLAAQFQTPELFIVAPDLREKVHVFASVDEADIGLIQVAQREGRPVNFGVDAHPEEVFHGEIEQIRVSSVSTQNVVTYPVVIAAANPDLKLLPGMTANISFDVGSSQDVRKVPNSALRFYPEDVQLVREEDRKLLDGSAWEQDSDPTESSLSAAELAAARKQRSKRHVWVAEAGKLKAVEIETGLAENRYTEVKSGDLEAGDAVVTGVKPKT